MFALRLKKTANFDMKVSSKSTNIVKYPFLLPISILIYMQNYYEIIYL